MDRSSYFKYTNSIKNYASKKTANTDPTKKKKRYITGDFRRFNPRKYMGDLEKPISYRSSYELVFMQRLEFNPQVKRWHYENFVVPYYLKEKIGDKFENKKHNYIIDFYVEMVCGKKYLVEIKPTNQQPKSLSDIKSNPTIYKNTQKWRYALKFCKQNGYELLIIGEDQLKMPLK